MRVLHACSACMQCMGVVDACSACVQCMRAVHARSACVQCIRAVQCVRTRSPREPREPPHSPASARRARRGRGEYNTNSSLPTMTKAAAKHRAGIAALEQGASTRQSRSRSEEQSGAEKCYALERSGRGKAHAWVQCMHAVHGCSGCAQCMCAVPACSAWV